MNWKSLLLLVVIAAAAVWGVFELNKTPDTATDVTQEQILLPGFEEKANDIDTLRITKAGGETVAEIKRHEQNWVVSNKSDYPADVEKIRSLLIDLVDARIVETKTANPEYYERLGVTDISDAAATGSQVELGSGDERLSLIVGAMASGGSSGTYVRRSGEEQSYLIGSTVALSTDAHQWLQQPILEIPFDRVQRVTIRHPDGEILTLVRENRNDQNFKIFNMLAGRELSYETVTNPTASALANLRLEDVVPATEMEIPEDQVIIAEYDTFDGLKLTARLFKQDDKYYAALQSTYDAGQAAKFAEPAADTEASTEAADTDTAADAAQPDTAAGEQTLPAESSEETSEVSAQTATTSDETVRQEAEELNQRLSEWVYGISEFKFESMSKRLEDMLKPVESSEAPAGTAPDPASDIGNSLLIPPELPAVNVQESPVENDSATSAASEEIEEPAAADVETDAEETMPAAADSTEETDTETDTEEPAPAAADAETDSEEAPAVAADGMEEQEADAEEAPGAAADSDDTEADDTEAGDTEAGDTEADDTEADDTEAGDTEAGDTDAGDTDAGDTEADDTDADTDPTTPETDDSTLSN